jgi:hypothetical protein
VEMRFSELPQATKYILYFHTVNFGGTVSIYVH